MAEFWNKMNGTNDSKSQYIESEYLDCHREWRPVIIMDYMRKITYITKPIKLIGLAIYFIMRLLVTPWLIFKRAIKDKRKL